MPSINDSAFAWPPPVTFATSALANNSTAAAGQLSGSGLVILNNSANTPGTYTTRTATQMIADSGLFLGQQWWLLLVNGQGTGTLTFTAGSGVTIVGTATVATNVARLYLAQVTNTATPAIVFTNLGLSFTATALAFGA